MNKIGTIYTLSELAGGASGKIGSQADLQAHLSQVVHTTFATYGPVLGDWTVVWGPYLSVEPLDESGTLTGDETVVSNAMFVAKGHDPETGAPLYVVSVAGTDFVSAYDWFMEDFDVSRTVPWPSGLVAAHLPEGAADAAGDPTDEAISMGTHVGVTDLLALPVGGGGTGIRTFLTTTSFPANAEIAFAGHSLGGALAPTLAYLFRMIQDSAAPGTLRDVTISAYPTAGPTPGNAAFAAGATAALGAAYHSVNNAIDVVPHVWQQDLAEQIPGLYQDLDVPTCGHIFEQGIPASPLLVGMGFWAANVALFPNSVRYRRIGTDESFTGGPSSVSCVRLGAVVELINHGSGRFATIKAAIDTISNVVSGGDGGASDEETIQFLQFMAELAYQHTTAYAQAAVFDLPSDIQALLAKIAPSNDLIGKLEEGSEALTILARFLGQVAAFVQKHYNGVS